MHVHLHATIRFGRYADTPEGVTIPVGLSTAVSEAKEIEFKTLHAACEKPISKQNFCLHCGVEASEVLKGYEVAKGQFVTFTEDEVKAIKPPRSPIIELSKFVQLGVLSPLMIDKHTYLVPDQLKEDDYGALYQALVSQVVAGVGSQALYGKEHPCAVYPENGVLVMATLNLVEQLTSPDFAPPIPREEKGVLMAELVEIATGDFDPYMDLVSPSKEQLLNAIRAKEEGVEVPAFAVSEARAVVDIQDTLRASIAAARRAKKPVRKTRAAK